MTGSNRLLLGLGWSAVALWPWSWPAGAAASRSGAGAPERYRLELGFLLVAAVVAFIIPLTGEIPLLLGFALLAFFGCTSCRSPGTTAATSTTWSGRPPGSGRCRPAAPAAGDRHVRRRRLGHPRLAEPFAEALVGTGAALGIDQFLLVQWLAPLASEAPEFIVAILFASAARRRWRSAC